MSEGFVPVPIRHVKPWVAVVQPGDSVSRIAHRFTGNASRWVELVGANPQKELSSGNVAGSPYRVFSSLTEGEKLMVPASWPTPSGTVGLGLQQLQSAGARKIQQKQGGTCLSKTCLQLGASCGLIADDGCGQPMDCGACSIGLECINNQCVENLYAQSQGGQIDPYGALVQSILTTLPAVWPGGAVPPPAQIQNVVDVVAAWWPYAFPGAQPQPPTLTTLPIWQQIVASAIEFLKQAAQGSVSPDLIAKIIKAIPWDQIPWDKIPWQQIGQQILDGAMRSQFWQILISSARVAPSGPLIQYGASAEPFDKTVFLKASTWSQPPFSYVNQFGWQNVPWSSAGSDPTTIANTWGNIADPALLQCMAQHPERAQQLVQYNTQCGFDKDLAKLKEYMCDLTKDPAKCSGSATPPVPVVPGFPPGFNWACSPSPKCIADQMQTLGIPGPCAPMPDCIPAWYKTVTGQGLPASEKKSETNLPLVLGLSAAGIALVATVLVAAASD